MARLLSDCGGLKPKPISKKEFDKLVAKGKKDAAKKNGTGKK